MPKQRGFAHILVLIAVVGILAFIVLSNTVGFNGGIFSKLFPKPSSHASCSAPCITSLDLVAPQGTGDTGDGGNTWGNNKNRIIVLSNGDVFTTVQTPGTGYTSKVWNLYKRDASSGSWSMIKSDTAGREPAQILRGPNDQIYVIAWPGGLPTMWTSTDDGNTWNKSSIPGSWYQNDWPYFGAGISPSGAITMVQTKSDSGVSGVFPGEMLYATMDPSGNWSAVSTQQTDYRYTFSFVQPTASGLYVGAQQDVLWSDRGWTAPSGAFAYVFPRQAHIALPGGQTTVTEETPSSVGQSVNASSIDYVVDSSGIEHYLYMRNGSDTGGNNELHEALFQNGKLLKDVVINVYDKDDARLVQDSTGQFYIITSDNGSHNLLIYPAGMDGVSLSSAAPSGGYTAVSIGSYTVETWMFFQSPRGGNAPSDVVEGAFPGNDGSQWIAFSLKLRDSGTSPTPTATPMPSASAVSNGTAPTNLSGSYNSSIGGISLSWTGVGTKGVTYNLYRGYVNGKETLYKTGITATSYNDTANLQCPTDWWYDVTAVVGGVESPASNEIITYPPATCPSSTPTPTVTPTPVPTPGTPSNLQGSYNSSIGGMSLTWSDNTPSGTTYNVYKGLTNGNETLYKSGVAATSYNDNSGLQCGIDYWYKVTATLNGIESSSSNEQITYMPACPTPTPTPTPTTRPTPTPTPRPTPTPTPAPNLSFNVSATVKQSSGLLGTNWAGSNFTITYTATANQNTTALLYVGVVNQANTTIIPFQDYHNNVAFKANIPVTFTTTWSTLSSQPGGSYYIMPLVFGTDFNGLLGYSSNPPTLTVSSNPLNGNFACTWFGFNCQ